MSPTDTTTDFLDESPNAMAKRVMEEAMEQQQQSKNASKEVEDEVVVLASSNVDDPVEDDDDDDDLLLDANDAKTITTQIEDLVQDGLRVYRELEMVQQKYHQAKQLQESSHDELVRLRVTQEENKATIANLLKAVEQSQSRDYSRVASVESSLRRELLDMRVQRDEALRELAEKERQAQLQKELVLQLQAKLGRCLSEKIALERETRANTSLAKSLNVHQQQQHADAEFYKRKTAELQDQLQAKKALVSEQKLQIDELRRRLDRYAGQKRVASISAESGNKRGRK